MENLRDRTDVDSYRMRKTGHQNEATCRAKKFIII